MERNRLINAITGGDLDTLRTMVGQNKTIMVDSSGRYLGTDKRADMEAHQQNADTVIVFTRNDNKQ